MRNLFFLDRDPDPARTVFLGGSGRSGTTWLVGLINHARGFRYMFEPFWPRKVPRCRHFNIRQYLRPGSSDPRFLDVARDVVTGRIRKWWIDKYNRRFFCDRRLIKDIRANMLLCWLHGHFPDVKLIFLLRHPGAVALSRMRRGWDASIETILDQEDLISDHLGAFLGTQTEPRDEFERHVLLWCIENLVPLRQFDSGDLHVLFYEHLCLEPRPHLQELCRVIDLDFDEAMLKDIKKPSRQTQPESAIKLGRHLVESWRDDLSSSQIDRMQDMLGAFGLDAVYTSELLPQTEDPFSRFATS